MQEDGGLAKRRSCSFFCPQPQKIRAAAHEIVGATLTSDDTIQIWYMPLRNPSSEKPVRTLCKTPLLKIDTAQDATSAVATIRKACCLPSPSSSSSPSGPRRVLAIINPTSGRGNAPLLFQKQLLPILLAAGIEVNAVTTQRPGHATEAVLAASPTEYDTIVSVGGDGTMNEVLQGVLRRPDWNAMRSVALVQAPCGSGNALAACTALWDVPTAAHAIVKACTSPLDVASVVQAPGRRIFSFLSLTYGTISCLDIGTEHLRWMGGNRFLVGAVNQVLRQPTFRVKVAYLDADDAGVAGSSAALEAIETGGESSADIGEGPPLRHLASNIISRPFELPEGWQWVEGEEVQLFAVCNLPRLDMNFHFAPEAALSSGHLNLVFSRGRAGRVKGLEMMTASEKGKHMHLVDQRRMSAVMLEPLEQEGATWLVVDGEAVPHELLFAEVHPALCTVLRAPEIR